MRKIESDTIFALSSGRPPAAIAVIRMSGPRSGPALEALIGKVPRPRMARLATIRDGNGEPIDEAVVLWFPGPNSETGEDVAELQVHGGHAVIAAVLTRLRSLDGLRPAEAGEFTRRAFESGKLDLTGVEGLADLIGAETDAQRRQAFRQLKGLLGNRAEGWRGRLIRALALVEAPIDFSDEGDVPADLSIAAGQLIDGLAVEITEALQGAERGEKLREGLVVAIAGAPNSGKSALLNRIAGRDVAIVSPQAGTTRDVIEVHLNLDGYPVTVLDTAGIRETEDAVEMEGVRRARERAATADVILWVADCFDVRASVAALAGLSEPTIAANILYIFNKIDITHLKTENEFRNENEFVTNYCASSGVSRETVLLTSALTGRGIGNLLGRLSEIAGTYFSGGQVGLVTRERHRHALQRALDALNRARAAGLKGQDDLIAEELRLAAIALGRLTGRVDVEDILDVLFRDFCIGK